MQYAPTAIREYMQVQMRKYEDDVNTTILEDLNREK